MHFCRARGALSCGILLFKDALMPKKRKKKTFSAANILREMARERVGSPKPSQLVKAKTAKAEKHKATLGKLLQEE